MNEIDEFLTNVGSALDTNRFVKITLSKPGSRAGELLNVYVRSVVLKNNLNLSFTYHFKTNDQTKNFAVEEGLRELRLLMDGSFQNARLFTTTEDVVLQVTKKRSALIRKEKPSITTMPSPIHDREKIKRAGHGDNYLVALGIMDPNGVLVPKMADKYRQINKYLEIIESLVKSTALPDTINIIDMGSGKGYLTFALYDYLKNKQGLNVHVAGIEVRKDLVDYCNATAEACGFSNLKFYNESIRDSNKTQIDILIALHACDTATDDAIAKGIFANASLIVCAPCCHKQIRQQVKGKEQTSPLMKYGIFKERQFEMVTDTIRALIMEKKHYQTKIFEFVSNEHTRKNILLVGAKTGYDVDETSLDEKINAIKADYQIDYHYLETLTR